MIGIIDSGYGGLSVVQELVRQKRKIPFLYLGDNAHNPYGTKTKNEITAYGQAMIDYMLTIKPEIETIIIACNTLCAASLPELEQLYPQIMFAPITRFGARGALMSFNTHVSVMATQFTVQTNYYPQLIHRYDDKMIVQQINAQRLVAMVERGQIDRRTIKTLCEQIDTASDVLILGCTHFPFLYDIIREHVAHSVQIIDPAVACIAELAEAATLDWATKSCYFTTGTSDDFDLFVQTNRLPRLPIQHIDLINI